MIRGGVIWGSRWRLPPRPRSVRDRRPRVGPPDATCSSRVRGPRERSGCAGASVPAAASPDFLRPRPPRRPRRFDVPVSAPSSPEDAAGDAAASGWASSRWLAGVCEGSRVAPLRLPLPRPPWRRRCSASTPSCSLSLASSVSEVRRPVLSGASTADSAVPPDEPDPDPPPRPRPPRPRPPRLRLRVDVEPVDSPPSSDRVCCSDRSSAPSSLGRTGASAFCRVGVRSLGALSPSGALSRTGVLFLGACSSGVRSRGSSGARSGARVAGSPDG